ncbi:TPA: pilus assembly protein PilS, partial [Neisseria gonorrhoeae]
SRFIRTETHRIKRFPQFHFLDSRLRGNDDLQ